MPLVELRNVSKIYHLGEEEIRALDDVTLEVSEGSLTALLSGGFHRQHPTHEQFAFAVELSRITIPYLMLICLASLLGGILNSVGVWRLRIWNPGREPVMQSETKPDQDDDQAQSAYRHAASEVATPGS